jgi:nitrogen fixation NifU-like protein
MDALYRDYILEHYKNPRNFGELEPHDLEFHDHNPLCGDELGVHIVVEDGRVKELRFHGQGCAISQATASIISDELKGKTVSEVAGLDRNFVTEEIGIELSPTRLKCGLLSLKVVQGALLGTDEWPSGTPDEDPDEADVARLRNEI